MYFPLKMGIFHCPVRLPECSFREFLFSTSQELLDHLSEGVLYDVETSWGKLSEGKGGLGSATVTVGPS